MSPQSRQKATKWRRYQPCICYSVCCKLMWGLVLFRIYSEIMLRLENVRSQDLIFLVTFSLAFQKKHKHNAFVYITQRGQTYSENKGNKASTFHLPVTVTVCCIHMTVIFFTLFFHSRYFISIKGLFSAQITSK